MNLIDLLRSLPMQNYSEIGSAINYADIYNELKAKGFENQDILNSQLRKLNDNGVIELFCMDDFDKNLIYAVRFK